MVRMMAWESETSMKFFHASLHVKYFVRSSTNFSRVMVV